MPLEIRIRAFPGEFAGASLKVRTLTRVRTTSELIPRRIRRGLIEGSLAKRCSPAPAGTFPGEFAGASLKALPRAFDNVLGNSFPGEFAGASLKDLVPQDIDRVPHGIPRRIRRGLIEGENPQRIFQSPGIIPRRIRRGLIEGPSAGARPRSRPAFPGEFAGASLKAVEAVSGSLTDAQHSPANSPGPH